MAKLTDLWVHIGAKTEGLDKGLETTKTKLKGFQSGIAGLGKLIAGAFAVSTVVAFASGVSKLALGVDEIESAFKRLNDPGLLARLRNAVSGTVSDVNLMKSAIRAESLRIPIKQLGTYFEFAERRASALGMSTEQAVESIIMGIGNKAPRAFRALGISSIEVQNAFAGIEPELLTVESVADRAFVMINDKLIEMGRNTESSTDKIEAQAAAWENTKTAFGLFWNDFKAFIAPAATKAIEGMGKFLWALQGTGGNANLITAKLSGLKGMSEEMKKQAQYEEDKNRVIALGDAKKRIAEDNARIAAEKAKKNQTEYNKLVERAGEIIEKRGPSYAAPDVPKESMPDMGFGTPDAWADAKNRINDIIPTIKKVENAFESAKITAKDFSNEIVYLGSTSDSLKDFAKEAANAARQFIASQIASGIATIIAKTFESTKNPALGLILGSIAGGAAAAVFNSAVPKFARGGITDGPTLAMVGDNPSGKEMIIPSEQWGKMGQNITIRGELRGRDIWWSNKLHGEHLSRTT